MIKAITPLGLIKGHYPSWFNNISTSKTLTKDSTPEKDLDIDRE